MRNVALTLQPSTALHSLRRPPRARRGASCSPGGGPAGVALMVWPALVSPARPAPVPRARGGVDVCPCALPPRPLRTASIHRLVHSISRAWTLHDAIAACTRQAGGGLCPVPLAPIAVMPQHPHRTRSCARGCWRGLNCGVRFRRFAPAHTSTALPMCIDASEAQESACTRQAMGGLSPVPTVPIAVMPQSSNCRAPAAGARLPESTPRRPPPRINPQQCYRSASQGRERRKPRRTPAPRLLAGGAA